MENKLSTVFLAYNPKTDRIAEFLTKSWFGRVAILEEIEDNELVAGREVIYEDMPEIDDFILIGEL